MAAASCVRWPGSVLCVVALGGVAQSASADQWTFENSINSRLESNDNVSLTSKPPGIVNSLYLSNSLSVARRVENASTQLNAAVTAVQQAGRGGRDRVDGQVGLVQTLSDQTDSVSASALYSQDFNNVVQTADVSVGRGLRRTTTLSGTWSHALTERLSASTQLSLSRTGYGQQVSSATDFRNSSAAAGLSYRWTEIDTLSLQGARSEYRTGNGGNRSSTDSISLGLSRVLSEQVSASLSLGVYRTLATGERLRAVCPLEVSVCNAGLLPYILLRESVDNVGRGFQYTSSYRYQFDERTDFAFSSGKQQAPSGAGGVVRSDTLSLALNHSFSERTTGSMNYGLSRARSSRTSANSVAGVTLQQSVSASITRLLALDLSLGASYQFNSVNRAGSNGSAQANSINVSLKYDWPKLDATR